MSADEHDHPSLTGQLARDAAREAAGRAVQQLAKQVLVKIGAVLGAKGAVIAAVALLIILVIAVIVAVAGAAFQSSAAVWPVPVATDSAGIYQAAGWAISSRYGWRDGPAGPEFHDGIDLAHPQGACPFGYHCGAPSMFDGTVTYVGWDQAAAGDPDKTGGGELVIVSNGQAEHQTLYAHLEPYRLYVQLQGRIDDAYGRYDAYRDYQPIGHGALQPDLGNGGIEMTCANDMPNFIPTRSGHGTVVFLYDRPASCTTTVVWGERGDGWQGWLPDNPGARGGQRADLRWQTPIEVGKRAEDVALRFRARLVPPPPPPTPVPTVTETPLAGAGSAHPAYRSGLAATGQGAVVRDVPAAAWIAATPEPPLPRSNGARPCVTLAGGWTRCRWAFADIPTERERFAAEADVWAVAAHWSAAAATRDQPAQDGEGPTVPPAQRLPTADTGASPVAGAPAQPPAQTPLPNPGADAAHGEGPAPGAGGPAAGTVHQLITPTPSPARLPRVRISSSPASITAGPRVRLAQPVRLQRDADDAGPSCGPLALVRLPNVSAPNPQLVAPAAASFAEVRAEIQARTGVDALAVLADVLRRPAFTTSKPGVLSTSWHKAGRAVDLNGGGPFVRVAEGRMFRLYVNNVDITAIFESHGWQRIPVQGDTAEWWHYEWHPDGIAWTSAMLQVWDLPTLTAAFPDIAWETIGCAGGSNSGSDPVISPQEREQRCVLGVPHYASAVETVAGCGPPVRAGDAVAQLDTTLGFVGLSGRTTGPHLHLGMQVRSYDGMYPSVDICTPEWLEGRTPPLDAPCFTDMADPLAFLPRAPGNTTVAEADALSGAALAAPQEARSSTTPTPIIPEGAPYQLPPPNYPGSLVFTPSPDATPAGQYWSPYASGDRYGGGDVGTWFCSVWSGWPWCT